MRRALAILCFSALILVPVLIYLHDVAARHMGTSTFVLAGGGAPASSDTLYGVLLVPAIVGVTQVAKTLGVPSYVAPIVALILGILAGLAELYGADHAWIVAVVHGIGYGLAAAGLYSAAMAVTRAPASTPPPTA